MVLFSPDQGTHTKVSVLCAIHSTDFFNLLLLVLHNLDKRIVAVFVFMLQLFSALFSCYCFSLQNCCLAVVVGFLLVYLFLFSVDVFYVLVCLICVWVHSGFGLCCLSEENISGSVF